MPEIIGQMMKPAEKIESIRIHQLTGLGGAPGSGSGGGQAGGERPAVNQVMDSILGMALQLPALKSIGDQIGFDFASSISGAGTTIVSPIAKPPPKDN